MEMTDRQMKEQLVQWTNYWEDRICEEFPQWHKLNISVFFDIRGYSHAGYAISDERTVHLNLDYAKIDMADFSEQIVGHEVAHVYIWHFARQVSYNGRRVVHGSNWKALMQRLGLKPDVHIDSEKYQVKRARKVTIKRYRYVLPCGCDLKITKNRHNIVMDTSTSAYVYCKKHHTRLSPEDYVETLTIERN